MIIELAALFLLPFFVAGSPPATGAPDCGADSCASAPPDPPVADGAFTGRWTFVANGANWTVDVGADGRIHAEGERSVTIGRDRATYRSTLEGTLTETSVALSITADNFSLPNFVPGPPTICTGTAIGMERYRGACARDHDRMEFTFSRE